MKENFETKLFAVPNDVSRITRTLKKAGFEAYLVGGCVRDLLLKRRPRDWDITTNAKPEDIIRLFKETFYENDYGTVGVVSENVSDETLKVVEVTPYRLESEYSDKRRPDSVIFSDKLEDDLQRRDFTINSIALDIKDSEETGNLYKGHIIDPYKGQDDLKSGTIKTVGDPHSRFSEDGLRLLRAVRISSELGFTINTETEKAIKIHAPLLQKIAKERVKDEFIRIIMSDNPMDGLILCRNLGLLQYIIPELEKSVSIEQNSAHAYDVWEHLLRTVQHSADKKWPLEIRLAALLHDISKPETRRWGKEQNQWTFYGHDVIGSRTAVRILSDLKFSKKVIDKVSVLVRWHMFFSDTEQITLSAVRRMIANVGKDNIWDLMNLRICDRIGTGRPKESPYRLRKYRAMIEEAMIDPVSVGMIKIDGNRLIKILEITPSPKIGYILHALLDEVLENPKLNTEEYLEKRAMELAQLPELELKKLGEKGKQTKEIEEEKKVEEIRKKYWVR
ncbi:HD domain-containing protein [Patescibacteria group bacterium]|nr:HD domain-containing protein [Patescibacteria group bacterium]MDE1988148.1 HD domain-containing protein [Patescibacteria group bacterium]